MPDYPLAPAPTGVPELFSLAGRVALVTGSGQGLGFVMAAAMAECGAFVYLNGRQADVLETRRQELAGHGWKVGVAAFDVTDAAASGAAIERIAEEQGRLDILVNNAGPRLRKPIGEIDDAGIQGMLNAHVVGPFQMVKQAAEHMKKGGYGRVIMVSSPASLRGIPNDAAYTASKGAINSLTRALALEYGRHGITVNTLIPGGFRTESNRHTNHPPRGPLMRWGQPPEIAGACVFLASAASNYVTAVQLLVDGGVTAAG